MKSLFIAGLLLLVTFACTPKRSIHSPEDLFTIKAQEDTVRYGESYRLAIFPTASAAGDVAIIGGQVYGLNTHLPRKGDTLVVEFTPLCQKQVDGIYTEVSEGVVALEMRFTVTYAVDADTLSTTVRKTCFTDCSQEMVFTQ